MRRPDAGCPSVQRPALALRSHRAFHRGHEFAQLLVFGVLLHGVAHEREVVVRMAEPVDLAQALVGYGTHGVSPFGWMRRAEPCSFAVPLIDSLRRRDAALRPKVRSRPVMEFTFPPGRAGR